MAAVDAKLFPPVVGVALRSGPICRRSLARPFFPVSEGCISHVLKSRPLHHYAFPSQRHRHAAWHCTRARRQIEDRGLVIRIPLAAVFESQRSEVIFPPTTGYTYVSGEHVQVDGPVCNIIACVLTQSILRLLIFVAASAIIQQHTVALVTALASSSSGAD